MIGDAQTIEESFDDRLCVFGLGRVGLSSVVVFASSGFSVIGVDVDTGKVDAVNRGVSYLREPGLEELLRGSLLVVSLGLQ